MTQPVPTAPSYLDSLLARLVDMQKDVFAGSDSVPVSFYSQEQPVFWTNTITGGVVDRETEDIDVITYQITMRLVLALLTEGFATQAEQSLALWVPTILQYFAQRRQLKRTTADAALTFLHPRGAVITGFQVRNDIQNSGIGVNSFGIDFALETALYQQTTQLIW